jgi:hypothetical protein
VPRRQLNVRARSTIGGIYSDILSGSIVQELTYVPGNQLGIVQSSVYPAGDPLDAVSDIGTSTLYDNGFLQAIGIDIASGGSGGGGLIANNDSWGRNFTKAFFRSFSFKSARLPGESFSQCVTRVRAAGGSFTTAVDATSGVGAATYLSTTSFGRTTYSLWAGVPPREFSVSARNLSFAEQLATSAAGNGIISPTTAGLVGKVATPLAKVSGLATAVALGLEGGVLGACR